MLRVLEEGEALFGEMGIRDIPATLGGVAMGQAINAAIAVSQAKGGSSHGRGAGSD